MMQIDRGSRLVRRSMVYSGRLHFMRRLRIGGLGQVIFYAPYEHLLHGGHPEHAADSGTSASSLSLDKEGKKKPAKHAVTVLFHKFEALQLERIVGSAQYRKMIRTTKGKDRVQLSSLRVERLFSLKNNQTKKNKQEKKFGRDEKDAGRWEDDLYLCAKGERRAGGKGSGFLGNLKFHLQ